MKVLMVGSVLDQGGVGNVIMTLYHSLVKRNVKCDLVYYKGSAPSEAIIRSVINDGNKVHEILGVKQAGLRYIFQIKKLCEENQYDIVHIHTSLFIWLAALGAMMAGVKVRVGHAHGAKFLHYSDKILFFLEPIGRVLNRQLCTDFVTCSQISAKYTFGCPATFLANYVEPSELMNISNLQIEHMRQEIIPNAEKFDVIFGYAGCLDELKNASFLLDVMKSLKSKGVNPFLILAGDTKDEANFRNKIKNLEIEENVAVLGFRDDCRVIMQLIDYYISASKSEGMSLAMVEAQMSGKPCIVSSLISDESNLGIDLFHPIEGFDCDTWARKIQTMILEGNGKVEKVEAIQAVSITPYSEENVIRKLMCIYKKTA